MVVPTACDALMVSQPLSFSDDEISQFLRNKIAALKNNCRVDDSGGSVRQDKMNESASGEMQQQQKVQEPEQQNFQLPWEYVELVRSFHATFSPEKTGDNIVKAEESGGAGGALSNIRVQQNGKQLKEENSKEQRRPRSRSASRRRGMDVTSKARPASKSRRGQRNRSLSIGRRKKANPQDNIPHTDIVRHPPLIIPARSSTAAGTYGQCSFDIDPKMDSETSPPNCSPGQPQNSDDDLAHVLSFQQTKSEASSLRPVTPMPNDEDPPKKNSIYRSFFRLTNEGETSFQESFRNLTKSVWGLEFSKAHSDDRAGEQSLLGDVIAESPLSEKEKLKIRKSHEVNKAVKVYRTSNQLRTVEENKQSSTRTSTVACGNHQKMKSAGKPREVASSKIQKNQNIVGCQQNCSGKSDYVSREQNSKPASMKQDSAKSNNNPSRNNIFRKAFFNGINNGRSSTEKAAYRKPFSAGVFCRAKGIQTQVDKSPRSPTPTSETISSNSSDSQNSSSKLPRPSPPTTVKQNPKNHHFEASVDVDSNTSMPFPKQRPDPVRSREPIEECRTSSTSSDSLSTAEEDEDDDSDGYTDTNDGGPMESIEKAVRGMDMDALFDTVEDDEESHELAVMSLPDDPMEYMPMDSFCSPSVKMSNQMPMDNFCSSTMPFSTEIYFSRFPSIPHHSFEDFRCTSFESEDFPSFSAKK